MRKPTRAELENRIRNLEPYQEAFFCLQNGEAPITIKSGEFAVQIVGMHRASGGVVINGPCVDYACDWCQDIESQGHLADPYLREIANRIRRLQKEACEARYA